MIWLEVERFSVALDGGSVVSGVPNQAEEIPRLGRSAVLLKMGFADLRSFFEFACIRETEGFVKIGRRALVFPGRGNLWSPPGLPQRGDDRILRLLGRHARGLGQRLRHNRSWQFECLGRPFFNRNHNRS